MVLEEIKKKIQKLTEIQRRISIGFRLKEDMDWLINEVKLELEKEDNDKQP